MSVVCTHHCRPCGRHFHSLEAFDAHIRREVEDGPRVGCFAPDIDDEIAHEFVGFAGECAISNPPEIETDVAVFDLASRRHLVRVRKEEAAV
jgi:hypothetical protein